MTINRWMNAPEVGFPRPIKIVKGGKNFWLIEELDEFDARMAAAPRTPGKRPGPGRHPAGQGQLEFSGMDATASAEAAGAPEQTPAPARARKK
jgi:hypothetical protein